MGGFTKADVVLVTCSYAPDLEIFAMLCESIDRHATDYLHVVAVPRRDMRAFAHFASARRRIVPQEAFLPRGSFRVPMPPRGWRRTLGFPSRDQFWLAPFRRVSGWTMQQVVKLEAARTLDREIIVHLDSDTVLIRPLRIEDLAQGESVRLFRSELRIPLADHQAWARDCARALGIPEAGELPRDFVTWPVVWRRSVVEALKARIERNGGDWGRILTGVGLLSEYHLYGLFCEFLYPERSAHFASDEELMLTRTFFDHGGAALDAGALAADLRPAHVGCCLQSTLAYPSEARRAAIAALSRAVEALSPAPDPASAAAGDVR